MTLIALSSFLVQFRVQYALHDIGIVIINFRENSFLVPDLDSNPIVRQKMHHKARCAWPIRRHLGGRSKPLITAPLRSLS
ncbi:hypothetical protein WK52_14700 [Burkholderia multivorans]|nr:hypothetical protein WK52_14700 [Burkholderia multivorans]